MHRICAHARWGGDIQQVPINMELQEYLHMHSGLVGYLPMNIPPCLSHPLLEPLTDSDASDESYGSRDCFPSQQVCRDSGRVPNLWRYNPHPNGEALSNAAYFCIGSENLSGRS